MHAHGTGPSHLARVAGIHPRRAPNHRQNPSPTRRAGTEPGRTAGWVRLGPSTAAPPSRADRPSSRGLWQQPAPAKSSHSHNRGGEKTPASGGPWPCLIGTRRDDANVRRRRRDRESPSSSPRPAHDAHLSARGFEHTATTVTKENDWKQKVREEQIKTEQDDSINHSDLLRLARTRRLQTPAAGSMDLQLAQTCARARFFCFTHLWRSDRQENTDKSELDIFFFLQPRRSIDAEARRNPSPGTRKEHETGEEKKSKILSSTSDFALVAEHHIIFACIGHVIINHPSSTPINSAYLPTLRCS